MHGKIIVIGKTPEDILKRIHSNRFIVVADALDNFSKNNQGNEKGSKNQFLAMKDFKKRYKKNNVDYIICNYEDIQEHLDKFIRDSVYVNSNKIYFYGSYNKVYQTYNIHQIKKIYEDYGATYEIEHYDDYFLVTINNTKSKSSLIKNLKYRLKNLFRQFLEILEYFLYF